MAKLRIYAPPGMAFNDEAELEPVDPVTPEDRCACKEETTLRLQYLGLTDFEIELFFTYTQSPHTELDES